jgi:hypothetical protein
LSVKKEAGVNSVSTEVVLFSWATVGEEILSSPFHVVFTGLPLEFFVVS